MPKNDSQSSLRAVKKTKEVVDRIGQDTPPLHGGCGHHNILWRPQMLADRARRVTKQDDLHVSLLRKHLKSGTRRAPTSIRNLLCPSCKLRKLGVLPHHSGNAISRCTRPAAHAGQYAPHVQQIGRPRLHCLRSPHFSAKHAFPLEYAFQKERFDL